ncbi:uncharacterized protein A1O9_05907 [Exophiala aquamarina CBS 119918]|uniref:Bifunctional lycopene cyclase/phytoene synthase n=1 Tax=Exophiala aquamarina CBS 119918 TaxID=1182545 RepID=A0A072PD09_9EURO|nr:uncharacterized protein A1O9_05907 [Exophiala aquamarina CBS 119918]KEF57984.1 hypothetical protein A1O9_05907 [Exophiala aquamarina CBS 119918]
MDSHIIFTIPIAVILSILLGPLFTRRDVYKICFLEFIAVAYTIPWDSYLIRTGIWTYPPTVIIGPRLFSIPVEELFFIVVQTYITTCIQIFLSKSVMTATHLHNETDTKDSVGNKLLLRKRIGQVILLLCSVLPPSLWNGHSKGTYMILILSWSAPVMLMLWTFAYQLLLTLPTTHTLFPVVVTTLYLWIVDTFALHRGTWSIAPGTKLGIYVWPHLELEEAIFFLVTNVLVVWGATAYDNAVAILDVFPVQFPHVPGTPPPIMLLKALFLSTSKYDVERLEGLNTALSVLARKSRSFYLASGVFVGRLRIDLILLYGFCRVADDLIDNVTSEEEAETWVKHFSRFLDVMYSPESDAKSIKEALNPFPSEVQSVLLQLPVDKLPSAPFHSLLDGFRMDQKFLNRESKSNPPIQTFEDLQRYATCVASTIGELCLHLVFYHDPDGDTNAVVKQRCLESGARMGRALQYVNIVRDVPTDAEAGRCYIPAEWITEPKSPIEAEVRVRQETTHLRKKILDIAFALYVENRDAIEELPPYARAGIRVAVESYMEIGRMMRYRILEDRPLNFDGGGRAGRASVPKRRRLIVGWRTMRGWRGDP